MKIRLVEPKLFRLHGSELSDWGDYGRMLQHGMTGYRRYGLLKLYRTGPFAPPITFPFPSPIVDNRMKLAIEGSDLFRSVVFRPVIKEHIVKLDWQDWDLGAEEPQVFPVGGEPENYILEAQHDPATADQMPEFWELLLIPAAREDRRDMKRDGLEFHRHRVDGLKIYRKSWDGNNWFSGDTTSHIYVTEAAREWLEPRYGEWLVFEDVEYSNGTCPEPGLAEALGY